MYFRTKQDGNVPVFLVMGGNFARKRYAKIIKYVKMEANVLLIKMKTGHAIVRQVGEELSVTS